MREQMVARADLVDFLEQYGKHARNDVYAQLRRRRDGKSIYVPVEEPLTRQVLEQHLSGQQPIGLYLFKGELTRMGAFDMDSHTGEGDPVKMRGLALRMAGALAEKGVRSFAVQSGGGHGVHLTALFEHPQEARLVRALLISVAAEAGLKVGTNGISEGEVEVFPKQDRVLEGKFGNLLAVPFSRKSVPLSANMEPIALSSYTAPKIADIANSGPVPKVAMAASEPAAPSASVDDAGMDMEAKRSIAALKKVDADDYDRWIKAGLILKDRFDEAGYSLWEDWSRTSAKFLSAEDCRARWDGLTPTGEIGLGTLMSWANGARDVADSPKPERPREWLSQYIVGAADLAKMELVPREFVVEPFLTSNSLSMIYAERGLGKTWFALSLACAIARGEAFLDYDVPKARWVLYIDGEMPLVDLQARVRALSAAPPENFMLLPSETLFREARPLNLHDPVDQQAIELALVHLEADGRRPEVLFFDNLSSLTGGVDENDNSALDKLLQWLIGLRHKGYTVVLVHHAGKNGTQRGASRREDLLDTSISLRQPPEDSEIHQGAHFQMMFPKTRGRRPSPHILELRLMENHGEVAWLFNEPRKVDRGLELLRIIWEQQVKTQKELADIAHVSAGAISQQCTKLRKAGNLGAGSAALEVTLAGKEAILEAWPELEGKMRKQGDLLRDII